MILRNLTDAARDQNWFAVVVEILVVVIGLFIGLQVDDWNTRRQERALLDVYMVRLAAETSDNIEAYREYIDNIRALGGLLTAYHDHLLEDDQPMPDEESLSANLCRNGVMGAPGFVNSVLSEMLAIGYLRLIDDEELAFSLRGYLGEQNEFSQSMSLMAPAVRDAYDKFESYRTLRPLDATNMGNCSFDFDAFETNAKAASWIADAQRLHAYHIYISQPVLDALLTADSRLMTR